MSIWSIIAERFKSFSHASNKKLRQGHTWRAGCSVYTRVKIQGEYTGYWDAGRVFRVFK